MEEVVGEQLRFAPSYFTVEEGSIKLYAEKGYCSIKFRLNCKCGCKLRLGCHITLLSGTFVAGHVVDARRQAKLEILVTQTIIEYSLTLPLAPFVFALTRSKAIRNASGQVHRIIVPVHVQGRLSSNLWRCRSKAASVLNIIDKRRRTEFHVSIDQACRLL
jgi:hypothetical protein